MPRRAARLDRPPRDLRLTRPLRFRALDRVDRGAVQGEPRISTQIRALARVRHRAEGKLAVLEGHLDPGDPRRPVGSQGGHRLVPVRVEEPLNALRKLRPCALDVLPRGHSPNMAQVTACELVAISKTLRATARCAGQRRITQSFRPEARRAAGHRRGRERAAISHWCVWPRDAVVSPGLGGSADSPATMRSTTWRAN